MTKMIRLHRFGGNEVLRTEDLEQSQPDARQVLVSVRAASVNPVDFKIRDGKVKAVVDYPLPLVRASCYLLRLNPAWM